MQKTILAGRLRRTQALQAKYLLDMLYTPAEIAAGIGFSRRQFYRVYFPAGCPSIRDAKGHHWVNGKEFAEWYEKTYQKVKLGKDETFCLTCKQAVLMVDPEIRQKGGLTYSVSKCPNCGRNLPKFIRKQRML